MDSVIQHLSWRKIVDLFASAKERIVIIMPAIHDEWVEVISQFHKTNKIDLWVCFDNQEGVFRSGYGDVDAIYRLESMNATIKQCKDLSLGFLGVDNTGYSFHVESRIISGNPQGPNAILLNEGMNHEIPQTFFPEKFSTNKGDNLPIKDLQSEEWKEVTRKLEKNPPSEPDLQRQISTYNTLFQFAELHFEGGNLSAKNGYHSTKWFAF